MKAKFEQQQKTEVVKASYLSDTWIVPAHIHVLDLPSPAMNQSLAEMTE